MIGRKIASVLLLLVTTAVADTIPSGAMAAAATVK
jgi:hypothetical protein